MRLDPVQTDEARFDQLAVRGDQVGEQTHHRDHRAEDQQGAADNERLDMPIAGALQDEDQEADDRQDADESDGQPEADERSEEHTSELQSLMRSSYAVICLKKKKQ